MAMAAERALRKSIRDGTFERAYYFLGDDDFLKEGAARELADAVLDAATREFNFAQVRGGEATAEALDLALSTPPMFADRRLVVVRDPGALKRDARAVLMRYLTHPSPDVVLVLMEPAGEKADRELAGHATSVEFGLLDEQQALAWIAHHATSTLGAEISENAARLLRDAVGPETAALAAELDKLVSYTAGTAIGEDAVRAVVGVRSGEGLSDLLDAVADRDSHRAVPLVASVLAQPKTTAVTVIMALATQMTAIAWARAARDRGVPGPGISQGLFGLLKASRAYPGRSWGDAVGCWVRGAARWRADEIDRALDLLLVADVAAKESRVSSEEQLLTTLVLSLCARPERVAA